MSGEKLETPKTPELHQRAALLDVDGVRRLLEGKADVDACDPDGTTVLHKVLERSNLDHKNPGKRMEIVELLLHARADPYAHANKHRVYNYRQFTALHTAVWSDEREAIALLMKHGAAGCLTIPDCYGRIPSELPLTDRRTKRVLHMYMERIGLPPFRDPPLQVNKNC
jgi:ankyrin repeat protein